MKEITRIFIIIALLLLAAFVMVFPKINGNATLNNNHAYTKAICNSTNYCEDYLIKCNGNKLESMTPTGFAIQTNNARITNSQTENYCE